MKYDANGKPVEDLAESYTFDKATNTYTFKLRDGVKWHDGEDFNAEDVVYTYKELTEDETLGASITSNYQDITSIEAPDDQTVIFTLDQYDAAMLDYFTMGILPEHLLEGEDVNTTSFNQNPVGTGRYKFEDWDATGGMITLKRMKIITERFRILRPLYIVQYRMRLQRQPCSSPVRRILHG